MGVAVPCSVVLGGCLQSVSGGVAAEVEVVLSSSLENRRVETSTEEKEREAQRRVEKKRREEEAAPTVTVTVAVALRLII